jgi:hypothetical protein
MMQSHYLFSELAPVDYTPNNVRGNEYGGRPVNPRLRTARFRFELDLWDASRVKWQIRYYSGCHPAKAQRRAINNLPLKRVNSWLKAVGYPLTQRILLLELLKSSKTQHQRAVDAALSTADY